MKRLWLVSIAGLGCFCIILGLVHAVLPKNIIAMQSPVLPQRIQDQEDETREDGIALAQQMEFENTKDVTLGYVPKYRLIAAYQRLLEQRRNHLNSPANVEALSWTERGPNADVVGPSNGNTRAGNGVTSGRMRAIWVDLSDPTNHTVWVGGIDGGLWKTSDISAAPATWTPINDFLGNLAIGAICQDPLGTKDTMYFGTGEKTYNADAVRGGGVWKSVDHGVTWNLLAATTGFWNVSKVLCDAHGNVYVTSIANGKGIERSSDGGATWTNITPQGLTSNVTDMKLSSNGKMHIVCGYYNSGTAGYRFTARPDTVSSIGWTAPATPFPNVQYNCELAVKGDSLYVLNANSSYQTPQIYKSTDGGNNWTATATSPPAASGTNDLSSGQAWYNLALSVDPNNALNVIAGGLNCYRSTDGGNTWAQVSTWIGSSLSYVHADQQTAVWNGNQVLFGSDGGIFYSGDGGATFTDRNTGLRLKQYYSCAMHPTNTNYFLAGAQDNGVDQLTNAGLGSATEVTGGDGAFVQIDQNQPQYQFGAYVYNQYRRSTDGGATWASVNYSNSVGQFINPTGYDDIEKKMYAGGSANQYIRWENPQTGSTFTPVAIGAFAGAVKSIAVSPYTANRVFFGTSSGKIVQVDNANAAAPAATNITGSGMPGTTVSCVAMGTNDSNLIATFSNYGVVNHIWVTTTRGGTGGWTNITGNFPDIPVRWAIFYPEDNTKAIIATEMGVYETSNINGSSTVWTQDPSFPIVRTDMLKYRRSDGTVAAATHGRGLWTANIALSVPYISFANGFNDQVATTAGTTGCRNYKDYTVNMNIATPPTGNATVTLGVAAGGTATQGVDFDFTTNGNFSSPSNTLTFANGATTPQTITIRIYNNAEVENPISFTLNYSVSGTTNAMAAPSSETYTFNITNNTSAPLSNGAAGTYTIGTQTLMLGNASAGQPFNAALPSKRTQMLYKASELTAAGISAGTITSVAFNMGKNSVRPYTNLQIRMGTTSLSYLVNGGTNAVATSTVKSLASYATFSGWNTFTLDVPFVWDGSSNIAIEVCYDNATSAPSDFADDTYGYSDGGTASQGNTIWQDSINCSTAFTSVQYYATGIKAEIQLGVTAFGNLIDTSGNLTQYVGNNGNFYFYTGNYILNSLTAASANLGCVSSTLTGTGTVWQSFYGGLRSQKVYTVTPTTNAGASYTIGLYFTTAELAGLDPATLQIAKTDAATLSAATAANTVIATTTYASYADGYVFTGSFTGFSQFFLVNAGVTLPVTLLTFTGNLAGNEIDLNWKTSSEQNTDYFAVEKSADGNNFQEIGRVAAAGNSATVRAYGLADKQVNQYNYYRLRMVNADGQFTYSATIQIQDLDISQRIWVGNNPFRNTINIRLARAPQKDVIVELINAAGAKVYFKQFGASNLITLDVSGRNLAAGIYLLRTTVDGKSYTNKLLKQ